MTKPINIPAIEKATGKSWYEWLKFFDGIGAKDLPHKEIAQRVQELGTPGWWAQSVTVAYEQHIGRRSPGQVSDGTFQVSANKTVNGSMDETLEKWIDLAGNRIEFNGVIITGEPSVSKTEKWRNWRCRLSDGTRVVVGINQKTPEKSQIGLAHEKLESPEAVEQWRAYWKEFIGKLDD